MQPACEWKRERAGLKEESGKYLKRENEKEPRRTLECDSSREVVFGSARALRRFFAKYRCRGKFRGCGKDFSLKEARLF